MACTKCRSAFPLPETKNWDGCIVKPEQDCADPQPSAWTHSEVHTVVTDNYMQIGGVSAEYFKNRIFPGSVMNEMLVYMTEEQAGGEDAAIHFLQTREEISGLAGSLPKSSKK